MLYMSLVIIIDMLVIDSSVRMFIDNINDRMPVYKDVTI